MASSPSSTSKIPSVTPGTSDHSSTTSAATTGLSGAAKAGIGAGAGVAGVLIVLAFVAGVYIRRRQTVSREGRSLGTSFGKEESTLSGSSLHTASPAPGYSARGSRVNTHARYEMGHDGMIIQAPAPNQDPSEMSAIQQEVLEMEGSMYHRG